MELHVGSDLQQYLFIYLFHKTSNSQATALLFAEITSVVGAFKNESDICSWLMHQLSKIQALLTAEQTPQNIKKYLFAIDVFMLSIIAQTVAILLPDTLNANNRDQWIYIFPEALWIISERDAWTNSIPRVSKKKKYTFLQNYFELILLI